MFRCPQCDESIQSESINITEGFALCPNCQKLSRLAELREGSKPVEEILREPPARCTVETVGEGVVVRTTFRSFAAFLGVGFFCLFWNGIVSMFVFVAIAGLYTNLIGPFPDWFVAPGIKDGLPIMNDKVMGLWDTLFLCLFLTPFVLVGMGFLFATLMTIFGKVEVFLDEYSSCVATGAGFLVWKKRFDANAVTAVRVSKASWKSNDQSVYQVEIEADRPVKFGSGLSEEHREWFSQTLRRILVDRSSDGLPETVILPYWLSTNSIHREARNS
ncbi:hypothetical protein SH668x_001711 [Planctomicrobium sp. SH668]|uniref:hypothetical protein n=1 Tax=Planctomicrobium sp. SH668 TaxID=3448126 RepID=UPI003F5AE9BD